MVVSRSGSFRSLCVGHSASLLARFATLVPSIGQNPGRRDETAEGEGQGLQALALASRYAMSGTAWYVRGMTAFAGHPGCGTGGRRSVASGAQRPRCSRMRRTTPGSSISLEALQDAAKAIRAMQLCGVRRAEGIGADLVTQPNR